MPQQRKLHDRFFKQAKAEGYAARSAYKLKEIVQRRQLIRRGDWVVDLGCAPGSWTQVAAEIVGPKGRVIGIDLKPVVVDLPPNARTMVGDVFAVSADELMAMGGASVYDVVLSDMAPSTEGGGGGSGDHFRSVELCRRVLELCQRLLKPGGHMAMKVFEGEAYPELLKDTGRVFDECKGLKPEASRDVSREMFIVGKGYRGAAPGQAAAGEGRGA